MSETPAGDEPIVRIAARGEGVTASGRHAALAAPGDTLTAAGAVLPGPHHAAPPCRHFPRCGGCQLQHVDDAAYAAFVTGRIAGALAAQGLDAPPFDPVHLSPPRTRRRASLRAERIGRRVVIGFNEGASHRIVDCAECHILHPALFDLLAPLRALLGPMLRERRAAGVAMTLADQGIDLLLDGVTVEGLAAAEALTEFARAHGLARLSVDEGYGAEPRWEPARVTVTLGGRAVALPAGAFLQPTAEGEAALVAAVRAGVGRAASVADLFAGLGTFALALANGALADGALADGARVHAVEGARDALLALGATRAVTVEHRDLFRRPLAVAELARFEAIVLDPPRAGAREQMAALAACGAARIVYVSCNPATFARDARTLVAGGWRLARITPVGQFRWSTHVELAAVIERPAR